MIDLDSVFSRHDRIALQFSGGRDSLACLYLLRNWWDKLVVYWLDTGVAYPETISLVNKVREMVPNFARIEGRQPQVIAEYGMPSDLLPASCTPMGMAIGGKHFPLQDRYSCCLRTILLPIHDRMVSDGITLVIRGQKSADRLKGPISSGHVEDGIEYLFPIEDWTQRQVMDYLREQDAPIPRFYEMLNSTPDCMTCTAYWEEGYAAYQKRYHGAQYAQNQAKLLAIRDIVNEHIEAFNQEVI